MGLSRVVVVEFMCEQVHYFSFFVCTMLAANACTPQAPAPIPIEVVTYGQFEKFVSETGYVTDAEKFGWSIVQQDVFTYLKVPGATWRKPDGTNSLYTKDHPVTQVSYNDALAYCAWSGTQLPTYEQYWELIQDDNRQVISNSRGPIANASGVNMLGNTWEITASTKGNQVRLAGGSIFCSQKLCNGTSKDRNLYVDKYTGNVHIGFAVISKSTGK